MKLLLLHKDSRKKFLIDTNDEKDYKKVYLNLDGSSLEEIEQPIVDEIIPEVMEEQLDLEEELEEESIEEAGEEVGTVKVVRKKRKSNILIT